MARDACRDAATAKPSGTRLAHGHADGERSDQQRDAGCGKSDLSQRPGAAHGRPDLCGSVRHGCQLESELPEIRVRPAAHTCPRLAPDALAVGHTHPTLTTHEMR